MNVLQEHTTTFAWDYHDMKGIDPTLCMHKIYINDGFKPVRKPQRRMNLRVCDIVISKL